MSDGELARKDIGTPAPHAMAIAVLVVAVWFEVFGSGSPDGAVTSVQAALAGLGLVLVWVSPGWSHWRRTRWWRTLALYAVAPFAVAAALAFVGTYRPAANDVFGTNQPAVATGLLLAAAVVICLLAAFLPRPRVADPQRIAALAATGALLGGFLVVAVGPAADRLAPVVTASHVDHVVGEGEQVTPGDGDWPRPPLPRSMEPAWSETGISSSLLVPGHDVLLAIKERRQGSADKQGLVAFEPRTGKKQWHFLVDGSTVDEVAVAPDVGVVAFVIDADLVILDVRTGARTGQITLPGATDGRTWSVAPGLPSTTGFDDPHRIRLTKATIALAPTGDTSLDLDKKGPQPVYLADVWSKKLVQLERPPSGACQYRQVFSDFAEGEPNYVIREGEGCGPTRVMEVKETDITTAADVPYPSGHPCIAGCDLEDGVPTAGGLVLAEDSDHTDRTTVTSMDVRGTVEWQRSYESRVDLSASPADLWNTELVRISSFDELAEVRTVDGPGTLVRAPAGPDNTADHDPVVLLREGGPDGAAVWYTAAESRIQVTEESPRPQDQDGDRPTGSTFEPQSTLDVGCGADSFTIADGRLAVQCRSGKFGLRVFGRG